MEGFHAPMPPARTGVADYAAHLQASLRAGGSSDRLPVNLYHLGNNQLHAEIYRRALRQPGVVVLHDAVLQHFALGYFGQEEYTAEFVYNYGEWSRDLARELWTQRARSAGDSRYFEYPMLRRICETARAVIVHNPAAARLVLAHARKAVVHEIPHLVFPSPRPPEADIMEARRGLGVRPLELLCGVFGHLREAKRLRSVIEACGQAGVKLLVAGALPSDLRKSLGTLLNQPFIVRREYAPVDEYRMLTHAVDICANLRYPTAGETSGISVTLMAAGKAVMVTDSLENSRYPESACVRILPGLAERTHLATALDWLRQWPEHGRAVGSRAAEYVHREHSPARVAEMYWKVLRAAA